MTSTEWNISLSPPWPDLWPLTSSLHAASSFTLWGIFVPNSVFIFYRNGDLDWCCFVWSQDAFKDAFNNIVLKKKGHRQKCALSLIIVVSQSQLDRNHVGPLQGGFQLDVISKGSSSYGARMAVGRRALTASVSASDQMFENCIQSWCWCGVLWRVESSSFLKTPLRVPNADTQLRTEAGGGAAGPDK